jgi:ATP-dependent DNA helicase PIF1
VYDGSSALSHVLGNRLFMTQQEALKILKTGANVFLTGEPGSGKTHTVNQYVTYLHSCGIKPAITASTGIAATHIGGMTIHSWSGIGVRQNLSVSDLEHIAQNRRLEKRIRKAHVLIIDEISMLSAKTLAAVESVCRYVRGGKDAFGGLQVVLVGDFYQLPPIQRKNAPEGEENQRVISLDGIEIESNTTEFAFASGAWKTLNPVVCYLSEQHRQEDGVFLELLSAIRSGEAGSTHQVLLESRCKDPGCHRDGITQLFSHNADVDRINSAALQRLSGEPRDFTMESEGPEVLVSALKKGCLAPETLYVKVGARVMFIKNNFEAGYVNGTMGTVVGYIDGYPKVETKAGRYIVAEPAEWIIEDAGRTLATIKQVPLRLAWALTVHKSQGMSLDEAHMDLSRVFEYGQGYVALSRLRTLEGLTLAGFNEHVFAVHPEVQARDIEFRAASDAAGKKFADMTPQELATKHQAFVLDCGGVLAGINGETEAPRKAAAKTMSKPSYDVGKIRKKYPNAYQPWSEEQDEELKQRHGRGEKIAEIADAFGRKKGAIRSRLVKLGLD